MRLSQLIAIGSFLVIQVDHADRLIGVVPKPTARQAEHAARTLPPDVPAAVVVRVANVARGQGRWARVPASVEVPIERLAPDVGVVIGVSSDGDVVSIKPTRDLAAAYKLERTRLSPSLPRAVLGVVHARMLPQHRRLKQRRR